LFNFRLVTRNSGTKIAHAYVPLTIRAVSTLPFLMLLEQGDVQANCGGHPSEVL
jgi:hypothetical protein